MKPGLIKELKNDAGALFSAAALTADDYSETVDIANYDRFGLMFDMGTVSGTSPTLDVKVQWSYDGGTTWITFYPSAVNSSTAAAVGQITAQTDTGEFWDNFFPEIAGFGSTSINPKIRFFFDVGGTNPSFAFTKIYFVLKDYVGGV